MKKDVSIQIVRICAMFSILACHLVQELNNSKIAQLAQFFNVGVYIFLFLSGYLYGNKKIKNGFTWIIKRIQVIMIPIYIFFIFLSIIHIIDGTMEYKYTVIYLLDLQYYFGSPIGAHHLWFVSVIMICYFINILISKINTVIIMNVKINIIFILIIGLSTYLNVKIGQTLIYIYVYLLGYMYRNLEDKININILKTSILISMSIFVRVISKILMDGSIMYNVIIVGITHTILAIGIFYIVRNICIKIKLKNNVIIDYFDNLSFYIYITHYMFMVGPIRTMGITKYLIINILITLILTYISAVILQCINEKAQNLINSKHFLEKLNKNNI